MAWQRLQGFVGGTYTLRSVNVDLQRCVNQYPEQDESGAGKNGEIVSYRRTPGKRIFAQLPDGPIRGMWLTSGGRVFAVSGPNICEILADGSGFLHGTVESTSGTVSLADNGVQLIVVDGDLGRVVTLSDNTLANITDPEFPPQPDFVVFLDGYFLVSNGQTREVYFSTLYDGATWDGLDIFSKEGQPDKLRCIKADRSWLWCFGDLSYEVFLNTGDADNPFQRIPGTLYEVGIAAPHTAVKLDNSIFWIGADRQGRNQVWRTRGYAPERVSNFAVEQAFEDIAAADIAKGTAWAYQQDGHSFYAINFPTLNSTWTLDIGTGLWHERTYTDANGRQLRDLAEHHVFAFGKHLVGDYRNGNVYELRNDIYTDYGQVITLMRRTPHISSNGNRLLHRGVQIDMETGTGCGE